MPDATLYLRPTFTTRAGQARQSSGQFVLTLRFVSGLYGAAASFRSSNSGPKSLLPRRDVDFLDENNKVSVQWYRFLQYQYEKRLGGDLAPSIPDVQTNVVAVQNAATVTATSISAITQVVETNAASAAAAIEVIQNTAAPGAPQIPAPVLTVPEPAPVSTPTPTPAPAPRPTVPRRTLLENDS